MENYIREDELMHYGRKGMKWGQSIFGSKNKKKRSGSSESAIASKVKKKLADNKAAKEKKLAEEEAQKKAKAEKKKSVKQLSDEELRKRIARLELEKRYKDLAKDEVAADKGKDFVMRVLEKSGENLATQTVNHYGAKLLNQVIGEEVIYANNKKK